MFHDALRNFESSLEQYRLLVSEAFVSEARELLDMHDVMAVSMGVFQGSVDLIVLILADGKFLSFIDAGDKFVCESMDETFNDDFFDGLDALAHMVEHEELLYLLFPNDEPLSFDPQGMFKKS